MRTCSILLLTAALISPIGAAAQSECIEKYAAIQAHLAEERKSNNGLPMAVFIPPSLINSERSEQQGVKNRLKNVWYNGFRRIPTTYEIHLQTIDILRTIPDPQEGCRRIESNETRKWSFSLLQGYIAKSRRERVRFVPGPDGRVIVVPPDRSGDSGGST